MDGCNAFESGEAFGVGDEGIGGAIGGGWAAGAVDASGIGAGAAKPVAIGDAKVVRLVFAGVAALSGKVQQAVMKGPVEGFDYGFAGGVAAGLVGGGADPPDVVNHAGFPNLYDAVGNAFQEFLQFVGTGKGAAFEEDVTGVIDGKAGLGEAGGDKGFDIAGLDLAAGTKDKGGDEAGTDLHHDVGFDGDDLGGEFIPRHQIEAHVIQGEEFGFPKGGIITFDGGKVFLGGGESDVAEFADGDVSGVAGDGAIGKGEIGDGRGEGQGGGAGIGAPPILPGPKAGNGGAFEPKAFQFAGGEGGGGKLFLVASAGGGAGKGADFQIEFGGDGLVVTGGMVIVKECGVGLAAFEPLAPGAEEGGNAGAKGFGSGAAASIGPFDDMIGKALGGGGDFVFDAGAVGDGGFDGEKFAMQQNGALALPFGGAGEGFLHCKFGIADCGLAAGTRRQSEVRDLAEGAHLLKQGDGFVSFGDGAGKGIGKFVELVFAGFDFGLKFGDVRRCRGARAAGGGVEGRGKRLPARHRFGGVTSTRENGTGGGGHFVRIGNDGINGAFECVDETEKGGEDQGGGFHGGKVWECSVFSFQWWDKRTGARRLVIQVMMRGVLMRCQAMQRR